MRFFWLLTLFIFLVTCSECKYHWYCSERKFEKVLGWKHQNNQTVEDIVADNDIFNSESVVFESILRYCNTPDGCCNDYCKSTKKCFSSFGFVIGFPCLFFFFFFFFFSIYKF
jgi:hypothetical protein